MTLPGWMAPTAMLCRLPSRARLRVKPSTANLDVVYGAESGLGLSEEMEPMLMIRPPPCCRICPNAYLEQINGPTTLTCSTCAKSAAAIDSVGPPMAMPALLTSCERVAESAAPVSDALPSWPAGEPSLHFCARAPPVVWCVVRCASGRERPPDRTARARRRPRRRAARRRS
eukprot:2950880-Prymnesium_polylepis.1